MLSKIKVKQDINVDKLKESLYNIIKIRDWKQNQISLQHRQGISNINDGIGSLWYNEDVKSDIEFNEWYDDLKQEYLIEVLENLPFKVYRTRIMNIKPKRCYTMHRDKSIRFHIPIDTAEDKGRFIFDHGEVLNMPEGSCYILNTKLQHTAMNCHPELDRIHIVGCLEEKHETKNKFMLDIYEKFKI